MLDTSRVEALLEQARAEAETVGLGTQLEEQLTYLDTYAHPKSTRCTLYPDRAPYSFGFAIEAQSDDGTWRPWFAGGLIYHGPHDHYGSGTAPTFAVSVTPVQGWQVHT